MTDFKAKMQQTAPVEPLAGGKGACCISIFQKTTLGRLLYRCTL